MSDALNSVVVFTLDDNRYALPLSVVDRVVRAIEITPVSQGPGGILGIINLQGKIMPVVNLRRWLHLPEREIDPSNRMIVAQVQERTLVIVVDSIAGIASFARADVVLRDQIIVGLDAVVGVVKMDGDMIPIVDLARMVSIDIEPALAAGTLLLPGTP